MKKRIMVFAAILLIAFSQCAVAWAVEEGPETIDEKLDTVNIVRPLGDVVTDTNLFISAQIFDGAKTRLSVFKKVCPVDFSTGFNIVGDELAAECTEELVFESEIIENSGQSVFYSEETTESSFVPDADYEAVPDPENIDSAEATEEELLVERLGEVFGQTTESGFRMFEDDSSRDVMFYYKKLENVEPADYRIRFDVIGEDGAVADTVEKQVEVKRFSMIVMDEEEIKKEVINILSKSFTGIISR